MLMENNIVIKTIRISEEDDDKLNAIEQTTGIKSGVLCRNFIKAGIQQKKWEYAERTPQRINDVLWFEPSFFWWIQEHIQELETFLTVNIEKESIDEVKAWCYKHPVATYNVFNQWIVNNQDSKTTLNILLEHMQTQGNSGRQRTQTKTNTTLCSR